MSRILAALLGAAELPFRTRIGQLEDASGAPAADVKLTATTIQLSQQKIRQLNLDANDTSSEELYAALNQKYLLDDKLLKRAISNQRNNAAEDVMSDVKFMLGRIKLPKQAMSIRPAAAKKIIKSNPPKHTMKLLGYRSLDSMMKHEMPTAILAVAQLIETSTWCKQLKRQVVALNVTDFDIKPMTICYEQTERWRKLADHEAISKRHHAIAMPLSASLLVLPYGKEEPPAALLTTLIMSVTAINQLVATSSYLKLHQMRSDFSDILGSVVEDQSLSLMNLLDEPISWHLIHRYYSKFIKFYKSEIFEPYLRPEDFCNLTITNVVGDLAPGFDFWDQTEHLGMLDGKRVVSYNLHDVAVNACNNLPFEERITHNFKQSLWHELMLGYMKLEKVEQAILSRTQPELVENNN